ncbi:MAG: tetratricopeptide repeat protein [Nitrospiraceae bacterium]
MKHVILACLFVIALGLLGCTGDSAKEMFETAQFEEQQNNQAHAKQLYEAIIKDYPNSEYAKEASERLDQLSQSK